MGGSVYEGALYSELNGRYLFGDYMSDKVMSLTQTGLQSPPEFTELLTLNSSKQ